MDQTLPKLLRRIACEHPDIPAQYSRSSDGSFAAITYRELYSIVLDFAGALIACGIERGEHIGLISDNRKEWLQADMAIMAIGAADVPRGCDATERDLAYILSFAECRTVIAENPAQVRKILGLRKSLLQLRRLICFEPCTETEQQLARDCGVELLQWTDMLQKGHTFRCDHETQIEAEIEKGQKDDIACIIFTSGTTGEPKGVMLSYGNFITQLDELVERIYLNPGERAILVLPVWHAFERLCEYVILVQAAALCYSKPVGSILLADFQKLNPHLIPAVPRVFESIYDGVFRAMKKTGGIANVLFKFFVNVAVAQSRLERAIFRQNARFGNDHIILKRIFYTLPWLLLSPLKALGGVLVFSKIRAKLGTNFRGGISGGGALPPNIDEFFWAIGVNIVEGYGLTETAPVISVRPLRNPTFGTVGSAIRGVAVRIVDESGKELPPGCKGAVQIKGETVMKGYYRRADLTAAVMTADGWFDTGDIGMFTVNRQIVLRGRKKDTIVLRGGENVEPLPIEMKLNESPYIAQCIVVGQDQRYLGALIIPAKEPLTAYAQEHHIDSDDYEDLLHKTEIQKLFEEQIQELVSGKTGFKMFERIGKFALLAKPFEVGVELSAKQEIMRYKIAELYQKEISSLF